MALKRVSFATAHNASTFTSARWNFQPVPDGFGNAPIQLVEIAPGNPRFAYDPATGKPQGILIEEQRTNFVPFSQDATQWSNVGVAYEVGQLGILRGLTISRCTYIDAETLSVASSNLASMRPIVSLGGQGTGFFTDSVIVRQGNTTSVSFGGFGGSVAAMSRFNFETGQFEGNTDRSATRTAKSLGDGLWFLTNTFERESAELAGLNIAPTNEGSTVGLVSQGDFVDVLFAQREAGAFATSPIITNGTAVTRTADIVARTLGAEFNPNEGTVVVEVGEMPPASSTPRAVISLESPNNQNHFVMFVTGTNLLARTRVDGVLSATSAIGAVASGDVITVQYSSAGVSVKINGGSYVFIGQLKADTISVMKVGTYGAAPTTPATLNGAIKSITYEPRSAL